jgi:hypothetical protein
VFIRDFQTHGFHARVFELACFAYLESANMNINRSFERPDFLVSRDGFTLAIEAVTANPPDDQSHDVSVSQLTRLSESEILDKVVSEFPKRMGKCLRKKRRQRYHAADHVSGHPIVLMIAPYFEAGSGFYPDDAFFYCLYGPPESEPVWQGTPAFFWEEESKPISAVLYCNAFTVSRFFRLATPLGRGSRITAVRSGAYYRKLNESECALRTFEFRVGDPGTPLEIWSEGVTIFKNPFANFPLDDGVLPASCVVAVRDGYVCREVNGFHPVSSCMISHASENLRDSGYSSENA